MPLVFLHGIGTGPEAWQPQVEQFSREREVLTPRVPLDLAQAAADLHELVTEPSDLCGLSWGGLVALRYALARPLRVRTLTVCAGLAFLPQPLRALQYVFALGARGLAKPMREGARLDIRNEVKTLDMPTLVLCGERDRLNRPLSRRLAQLIPNARFELVPAAGHVANVDNPDAFNRLLSAFLPPAP
jgi:pimeloyl-ACP methyl ester carboxylesterase